VVIRHNDITIDRKRLAITVGERHVRFSHSVGFDAFSALILQPGLTRTELFERVYGEREDGGPEMGVHIFDVHFGRSWRRYFELLGVKLVRERRSGHMYFSLRRV
jgi:DNA-binding response OmpR family regulator